MNSIEPITLNGVTFRALNKWKQGNYIHLSFSSTDKKGETLNLCAYKSRSEMGFWREFVLSEGLTPAYYKGALIPITKEMGLPIHQYPQNGRSFITGIDYLQMTFIHLELQKYFNANLEKLKEVDTYWEFKKYMDPWNPNNPKDRPRNDTEKEQYKFVKGIKSHINDAYRQEQIEPFHSYAKDLHNRCGIAMNTRDSRLLKFSKSVQATFPSPEDPVLVYKDYKFLDNSPPDSTTLTGDIYKIKLGSVVIPAPVFWSPPPLSPTMFHQPMRNSHKDVILYFMKYNLDVESTSGTAPLKLKNKFIPILLTTTDNITPYGLYSKYILAGNYICKVFDYTKQCLNTNLKCTSTYSYIGAIYDKVYPYNHPKVLALIQASPEMGGKRRITKIYRRGHKARRTLRNNKGF